MSAAPRARPTAAAPRRRRCAARRPALPGPAPPSRAADGGRAPLPAPWRAARRARRTPARGWRAHPDPAPGKAARKRRGSFFGGRKMTAPVVFARAAHDEPRVVQVGFVEGEGPAGETGPAAAGLLDHALGRGRVPFHGRAQARVDVGRAIGDEAELERAAHAHDIVRAEALQKLLGLPARARAARDPDRLAPGAGGGADRLRSAVGLLPERPAP